jgi:hypothetical protein
VTDAESLRVFSGLPADERNTRIDAEFVPAAKAPAIPADPAEWNKMRDGWMRSLREKVFGGWPREAGPLALREIGKASTMESPCAPGSSHPRSRSSSAFGLRIGPGSRRSNSKLVVLNALDSNGWEDFRRMAARNFASLFDESDRSGADGAGFDQEKAMYSAQPWAMAYVAPRGVGPTAWAGNEKAQTQKLRRFYLLGQTWDGMQVWDLRRAIGALRARHTESLHFGCMAKTPWA